MQLEMTPSKYAVALFFAFAVVLAATLQPSLAIRVQVVKPAGQDASEKTTASSTNGDLVQPTTWPGFPNIPGLPPLLPNFPLPSIPPLHGCPPLPPIPGFSGHLPPHSATPSSPASPSPPVPTSPPSSPTSPPPPVLNTPATPAGPPPPPSQPTECLTSLMGLMPCMGYLTNTTVHTPPSTCCDGFKSIVDNAPICLCHGMNGDINKLMPAPMDFMRMMSLPAACNVPLPLLVLAQCSTRPVPPLMPPSPAGAAAPKPSQ